MLLLWQAKELSVSELTVQLPFLGGFPTHSTAPQPRRVSDAVRAGSHVMLTRTRSSLWSLSVFLMCVFVTREASFNRYPLLALPDDWIPPAVQATRQCVREHNVSGCLAPCFLSATHCSV